MNKKFWNKLQWIIIYGACVAVMMGMAFGGAAMIALR